MLLLSITLLSLIRGMSLVCDRRPNSVHVPKSTTASPFAIMISGNADAYEPGKQYTVSIEPVKGSSNAHRSFKEFTLIAENSDYTVVTDDLLSWRKYIGSWTLMPDLLSKFSEKCPNAITQTTNLAKFSVQVLWTAPTSGSGCIEFRATIVENRDLWYTDDVALIKKLCEESYSSLNEQPPVLKQCCACNEAKYEVAFESVWSRNTHPKDFPSNHWITKFSDLIGASHSSEYAVWRYGDYASDGLQQVAEYENTKTLEAELKEKGDFIRTIIKARGIKYPNITEKTFAVFRVDNRNHLMSLVSKIVPSPDWIVGVSNFELCLRNCSWLESKVLNLYPWDVGTDDGITYLAEKQASNPPKIIQRISKNNPNDPKSPFYDPNSNNGNMKPMARLYITQRQTYEKNCNPVEMVEKISPESDNSDCQVTAWSQWSACSTQCGKGFRYRYRKYLKPERYCNRHLVSKEICWGTKMTCDQQQGPSHNHLCTLTDWSEWSSCSVACGIGIKTRDRTFTNRQAAKQCIATAGDDNTYILQQNDNCFGTMSGCENPDVDLNTINLDCVTRPWSEWSPCSATCGSGFKIRTRIALSEAIEPEFDNVEESQSPEFQYDSCRDVKTEEQVECTARIEECPEDNLEDGVQKDDVTQPVFLSGLHPFGISMQNDIETNYNQDKFKEKLYGSASEVIDFNFYNNKSGNVINCVVSKWSKWTTCQSIANENCGPGLKYRYREVLVEPVNGGFSCPKIKKMKKCTVSCSGIGEDLMPSWGP